MIHQTNGNFKIRFKEHISDIKFKKTIPNSKWAKFVFENNHYYNNFEINKDSEILNTYSK